MSSETESPLFWSKLLADRLAFYFGKPRWQEKFFLYSRYLWAIDEAYPERGTRLCDVLEKTEE